MFTETFLAVLSKEGVAPIASWANDDAHLVATWNSYINVTPDKRLLIPAAGMRGTESDTAINNKIKITNILISHFNMLHPPSLQI